MGKAEIWVELCCRNCASTGFGRFVRGSTIPVREILRDATKAGWRQTTSGDFECGKCTKEAIKSALAWGGAQ